MEIFNSKLLVKEDLIKIFFSEKLLAVIVRFFILPEAISTFGEQWEKLVKGIQTGRHIRALVIHYWSFSFGIINSHFAEKPTRWKNPGRCQISCIPLPVKLTTILPPTMFSLFIPNS
jgi:hypothetical protein